MATHGDDQDDDDDINPIKMLFRPNEQHEQHLNASPMQQQQLQEHSLPSIRSNLVIRQLPSQGLSFQLWPAATTLVTLLDQFCSHPSNSPLTPILSTNPDHQGQLRILELGSGTGLVGMAAAAILKANVTVTDLPHVIPNLQFNVEANSTLLSLQGAIVQAAPLRWGEADDVEAIEREFDLILASDVVYHDHLFGPLLETLRLLLNSGGENKKMKFVMAHLRRWKKDSVFFKKAKKLFDVETIYVDRPCDGARIGVVVYTFAGKTTRS